MNHQPKVSVIIPCYNNERYIGGCIESVIHQSYKNLEIIVINDGSKDKTPEILRSYAEKDKRIVCINQNNKGVSAARNKGLSSATGDYIAFMDSDDEMLPDGIAHLVSEMKEDVDLVLASHVEKWFYTKHHQQKACVFKKESLDAQFVSCTQKAIFLWRSLYRKSIIDQHCLRFNESMSFAEDFCFNISYLKYIEGNIVVSDKETYVYYTYRSSLHKRFFPDMYRYYENVLIAINSYYGNRKMPEDVRRYYAGFYLKTLIEYYTFHSPKGEAEKYIFASYKMAGEYFEEAIICELFTDSQYALLTKNDAKGFIKEYYGAQLTKLKIRGTARDYLLALKKKIMV